MIQPEWYIDLHTHSTKSDGAMEPREVVRHAKEAGLKAIALSDHDSIEGVEEAMDEGKKIGIEVVPAIEFSVQSETETHILGYYIDIHDEYLLSRLEDVKRVREERTLDTHRKLTALGFDIDLDEVRAIAPSGIVGRAHFARVMANKGYAESVKDAFRKWLDNGRPAYSGLQLLTAAEAVELIKRTGGMAYVAHLHLIHLEDEPLEAFIKSLIPHGLDGIEGYYSEYTPEMQDKFQAMAKRLGIGISGGTDFHWTMKPHISIGKGLGDLAIPYSVLDNIKSEYKKQHERNA